MDDINKDRALEYYWVLSKVNLKKLLVDVDKNGAYITYKSDNLSCVYTLEGKIYLTYMLVLFYFYGTYLFDCEIVVVPDTANPNMSVVSLKFPWSCNNSEENSEENSLI